MNEDKKHRHERLWSGDNRKGRLGRRDFLLSGTGLAAGALLLAGSRPAAALESGTAALTTRERGRLKILAVTDLHFFNRPHYKDAWTLKDMGRLVSAHRPDLILVCGDMWYNNPHDRGVEFCQWACEHMAELKTPWALARGNHDQADDSGRAEELLTNSPYSLYRGGMEGNYTIEARDPGEAAPFWNMIIINDAYPELGFGEKQIKWFNGEEARIKTKYSPAPPAFVFFHIPLPQYQDVVDAGAARGVKMEKVSFEQGSRDAFPVLRDSGMVKAMFCGHDHLNNFHGIMDGVTLSYLRATGHGGYGGTRLRKGGSIITAEAASAQFSLATVFPSGQGFAWETRLKHAAGQSRLDETIISAGSPCR
jgi:hypothetical protein